MAVAPEWSFEPADAAAYLAEVARLWAWWIVGLALLVFLDGGWLVLAGIATLVGAVVLLRPLQARAAGLSTGGGSRAGRVAIALGRGHEQDVLLRALAYGTAPFAAALGATGASLRWVWVRHGVIALTIVGLLVLLAGPLT